MKKITYVTCNWAKIKSTKQKLEPLGYDIDNVKMETTEIQADTVEEVAAYSAKEACEKLKCPVLKNDTGLQIEALDGFPGPYTKYVDQTIGEDGLLRLLNGEKNRNACFIEAFAYCEPGEEPVVFKSVTKGTIANEKSGKYGWFWDYIFIPEGQNKTLGCYPDETRFTFRDNKGIDELVKYLENKN